MFCWFVVVLCMYGPALPYRQHLKHWLNKKCEVIVMVCVCAEIPGQGKDDNVSKGKPGKAGAANSPPAAPVLTGKQRAQAIIDAAFAEVKQDMARKANAGQHHHLQKPERCRTVPARCMTSSSSSSRAATLCDEGVVPQGLVLYLGPHSRQPSRAL